MKRGRPKSSKKAQNRVVSVVLDEEAYRLFHLVSNNRSKKSWIHTYVSEHIKRDFYARHEEQIAIQEMLEAQKEMHAAQERFDKKRIQVSKIKNQVMIKENKAKLGSVGLD